MGKKQKIDRLSELPDNLLCFHILPKLSLRDVIASSILSRRWRSLWTQIPCLHFLRDFYSYMPMIPTSMPKYTSAMSKEIAISVRYVKGVIHNILSLHSGPLESFRLIVLFEAGQRMFDQWIKCAAVKGVKQMDLTSLYGVLYLFPSLFDCHRLTDLKLAGFRFTGIPTDFEGFLHLKECSLILTDNLTDDRLQQLIALCPILQKLVLSCCPHLTNLKICSSSLSRLALRDLSAVSITADCPHLAELKLEDCHGLHKLELNSCVFLHCVHSLEVPSFGRCGTVKSLKKLSLDNFWVAHPLIFHGNFPELEELDVAATFILDIAVDQKEPRREMTAGKVVSDLNFPNLKK
ncbi:hypothetical protein KI387_035859, partial [Taxus chinensis]